MTAEVEALKKELAELKQALANGKPITAPPKPVQVDLKYLCPNDPNRKKLEENNGLVLPEFAPQHTFGWFLKIEQVQKKHRTFGQDGKEIEFTSTHMIAIWKCQHCLAEKNIDPYP